ncbi:MAG: phage holin family protein [Fimbriimonadaceae bacterium]
MSRLILKWVFFTVALIVAAKVTGMFMPGFDVIEIKTFMDALTLLLGAAVLALINATLGRVVKFLTIPLNCLTLGLFSLVVNAAMLMLAGSLKIGFVVDSFLAALVGSLVLAVVYGLLGILIPDEDNKD